MIKEIAKLPSIRMICFTLTCLVLIRLVIHVVFKRGDYKQNKLNIITGLINDFKKEDIEGKIEIILEIGAWLAITFIVL